MHAHRHDVDGGAPRAASGRMAGGLLMHETACCTSWGDVAGECCADAPRRAGCMPPPDAKRLATRAPTPRRDEALCTSFTSNFAGDISGAADRHNLSRHNLIRGTS